MIAKAPSQLKEQPPRRNASGSLYRSWEDYGPPPAPRPLHVPTRREVLEAIQTRQPRRFTPSQERLLRRLVTLSQDKGWCYFSTAGWQEQTGLPRTQLLRTRRELLDQQVIFFEAFPDEEPPYVTQLGNGWIGLRPMAEWLIPAKRWGGFRDGSGRKAAGCNNLNHAQASCNNLKTDQADCNNLNASQADCNNLKTTEGILLPPTLQAIGNNLKTAPDAACSDLHGGGQTPSIDLEIKLIQGEAGGCINLIQEVRDEASAGAAPVALSTNEKTYLLREDSEDTNVSPGAASAAPGDRMSQRVIEEMQFSLSPPSSPSESQSTAITPGNDEETEPTAELVKTAEQRVLSAAELAAWHDALSARERSIAVMSPGLDREAANSALWPERIAYLSAKRKVYPMAPAPTPPISSQERARAILSCIQEPDRWSKVRYWYIGHLSAVDFQEGCLLVRARSSESARQFNTRFSYQALSLVPAAYGVESIRAICGEEAQREPEPEPDAQEGPAEALPAPEYAELPRYPSVQAYNNAMFQALLDAWAYPALDQRKQGVFRKLGMYLRQVQIHPAYAPMFKGWCDRQLKGLVTPERAQSLAADFLKACQGIPYNTFPPLAQLPWLPQKEEQQGVDKKQTTTRQPASAKKAAPAKAHEPQEEPALLWDQEESQRLP